MDIYLLSISWLVFPQIFLPFRLNVHAWIFNVASENRPEVELHLSNSQLTSATGCANIVSYFSAKIKLTTYIRAHEEQQQEYWNMLSNKMLLASDASTHKADDYHLKYVLRFKHEMYANLMSTKLHNICVTSRCFFLTRILAWLGRDDVVRLRQKRRERELSWMNGELHRASLLIRNTFDLPQSKWSSDTNLPSQDALLPRTSPFRQLYNMQGMPHCLQLMIKGMCSVNYMPLSRQLFMVMRWRANRVGKKRNHEIFFGKP